MKWKKNEEKKFKNCIVGKKSPVLGLTSFLCFCLYFFLGGRLDCSGELNPHCLIKIMLIPDVQTCNLA